MKELKKGDLVCCIPSDGNFSNPKVGIAMQNWNVWDDGDRIVVKWLDHSCDGIEEVHYIQKLEHFGTVTF